MILFCDMHGHSRKLNIFMYGCEFRRNIPNYASLRLQERIFPRILWKNGNCFSFADSNFKVQKHKENTGEQAIRNEMESESERM